MVSVLKREIVADMEETEQSSGMDEQDVVIMIDGSLRVCIFLELVVQSVHCLACVDRVQDEALQTGDLAVDVAPLILVAAGLLTAGGAMMKGVRVK